MNIAAGLSSLDPAFAKNEANIWIVSQIFNGLVEYDSLLQIQPAIAKRWIICDSGATYTFFLRNDVYFHPHPAFRNKQALGRKVKAQDFVYSFTRIANPRTASPGQWIFNNRLLGIQDFQQGKIDTLAGLYAPNDTTLIIRLSKPFAPFLGLLTMPYCYVVPHEIVTYEGKNFALAPIGTGPFKFKSWKENQQLILLKNPHYYEKGLPHLEAISVSFIGNKLTALAHFLNEELDWLDGIDPVASQEILTPEGKLKPQYRARFRLQIGPQLTTEYIGLYAPPNSGHPLCKKEFRLALNYAINRLELARYVLRNMATAAQHGITPPGVPGFTSIKGYNFAPDSARYLLKLTEYSLGKPLPPLALYTTANYLKVAEYLQKCWEEIGLSVKIEFTEASTLREMAAQGKIHLWRASWMADYADAENFLALFYGPYMPPAGPNYSRYNNPLFNQWYEQLLTTTSYAERKTLYSKLEQLIIQDAPIIPLYYYKIVRITNKRFSCIPQAPISSWLALKYVH
ncbi:MAG: ABC transporter substrate-binding protein [Bacteroidia bacterium]|nr:ABC transporter substrate-binding protein [Bacteroidia bacterium]MDW8158598.1 ABC transporter substrate-binding protein [Bacteroidia bacterium]